MCHIFRSAFLAVRRFWRKAVKKIEANKFSFFSEWLRGGLDKALSRLLIINVTPMAKGSVVITHHSAPLSQQIFGQLLMVSVCTATSCPWGNLCPTKLGANIWEGVNFAGRSTGGDGHWWTGTAQGWGADVQVLPHLERDLPLFVGDLGQAPFLVSALLIVCQSQHWEK